MPTILVVEDNTSLRETLAYKLSCQEYGVQAVGDGLTTLDTARKIHPGLVLLNLILPGLDGIEVCRVLRQEMNIPILTTRAFDSTAIFNMDENRVGYLVKYEPTNQIFTHPQNKQAEDYVTGRFG